jgi:acyl-CoA hydrolase
LAQSNSVSNDVLMPLETPAGFAARLRVRRVFLAGFGGEPTAIIDALVRQPLRGGDVRLTGVVIPGVNRIDLSKVAPDGRIESAFVTPALRNAFERGRVDFRPMHYSALYKDIEARRDIELAIVRVSPPRDGLVSLGLTHDFTPALMAAGTPLAAMIDPATPFVMDGVTIPVSRFTALIDGPSPPIVLPPDPPRPELERIAMHVAGLVRDGDTIQLGLGSAPNAVLRALAGHKRLALYGGMASDAALDLLDAGALDHVTTGAAVVNDMWRQRLASEPRVRFRSVAETHGIRALMSVQRLVSINSALEVDLFGQANGEMLAGRQISGHGGVADYVRAARVSEGGRSIISLSSTGDRGRISRIVAALEPGTPVAITRGDIDVVVTEHGVAFLRDTDLDTRAARLIAIAAPAFRDQLVDAWDRRRKTM